MMTILVLILMVGFSITAIVLNAIRHKLEREDRLHEICLQDPLATSENRHHSGQHRHSPGIPEPSRALSSSTQAPFLPEARSAGPAGKRAKRLQIANGRLQPIPEAGAGRAKA